jgi:hypothetical protein
MGKAAHFTAWFAFVIAVSFGAGSTNALAADPMHQPGMPDPICGDPTSPASYDQPGRPGPFGELLGCRPLWEPVETSPRTLVPLDSTVESTPKIEFEIRSMPACKVQSNVSVLTGSLSSNFDIHEPSTIFDDPLDRARWKADENVRVPLWGPVYVFGQFGADCEYAMTQEVNFASRTGIGWKLPVWFGGEVQLRGGRIVSYAESLRPEDTHEHTDLFIELQGKWSLIGPVKLEYSGTALPAQSPLEHDRVNQDLHFAVPFRKTSSFRLGAKHNWEGQTVPRTWSDGMEVYLGLSLSQ